MQKNVTDTLMIIKSETKRDKIYFFTTTREFLRSMYDDKQSTKLQPSSIRYAKRRI